VDLAQVVREVVDTYQDTAKRSGIILKKEWGESLPLAWGDAERLKQVVRNLVDNAIKFSPDGGEVTVRIWDDEESLFCSVSDQGIGIAPALQERIFDRFYQVNGSTTRRFSGTGIGLALVRRIVEAHEGRVWVESSGVPGEGSTFTFSIARLLANTD
jgi:signal transduction histidine kinase